MMNFNNSGNNNNNSNNNHHHQGNQNQQQQQPQYVFISLPPGQQQQHFQQQNGNNNNFTIPHAHHQQMTSFNNNNSNSNNNQQQPIFFNGNNNNNNSSGNNSNTNSPPPGFPQFAPAPPQFLQQMQQQQQQPQFGFIPHQQQNNQNQHNNNNNNNNQFHVIGGNLNNNNNNNNNGKFNNNNNNNRSNNNNNSSSSNQNGSSSGKNNTGNNNNNNNNKSSSSGNNNNNANNNMVALSPNPNANNTLHHLPSFEDGVKKGYQDGFETGVKEAKGETVNLRARIVHLESQLQKAIASIKKLKSEYHAAEVSNRKVQQHLDNTAGSGSGGDNTQEDEIGFKDFAKGEEGEDVTHHGNSNNDPSLRGENIDDVTWDDSVSNRVVSKEHSLASDNDEDEHSPHRVKYAPGSKRRAASLVESIESASLIGGGSNVETTASGTIIPKQHIITAPPTSHVNYLYTSLDDVVYERFEPGKVFAVALPKSKNASHRIASECLLKTKALEAQRHVLTHCAHYYFNRICNRGDDCCFVHAISVPEIRVWGKTIDRQPIEFIGTAASTAVPTTTVVIQQQKETTATTKNSNNSSNNSQKQQEEEQELAIAAATSTTSTPPDMSSEDRNKIFGATTITTTEEVQ